MIRHIVIYLCIAGMVLCVWGLIHCKVMLNRNDKVFEYRQKLLTMIAVANARDIVNHDSSYTAKRFEIYKSVTYSEMMDWRHPFKPLDSYYNEDDFKFGDLGNA